MNRQENTAKSAKSRARYSWFEIAPHSTEDAFVPRLSNTAIFWVIVGAAFLVRAIVLLQLSASHPAFDQPIVDSRWHYLWAKDIAAGDWLGDGVYFRAPLYPYVLGVWIKLFGEGLWPIRLMQAFLGGLTAGLTFLIGQKAFGRKVGVLSGITCALYGTLIYYESELLVEVLAVPLGLWAVYWAMEESSRPTPRLCSWLGVGIVIGFFAITRPNILMVIPAFWWWAWPSRANSERAGLWKRVKAPAVLTLGVLLPIVPVTARNLLVAGDPVLISYQGGVNLWLGNNPNADGLTMQMPEVTLDESVEWDEFVRTTDSLASTLAGQELRPSEISSFWTNRALDWIIANPGAAIAGWLTKTRYFLGGFEVSDQTDIYAYSTYSWLLDILISRPLFYIPFGIFAPFGLLGLVLAWRLGGHTRPMVGFVVLYALTVVLFLATARHRLPVVPIFIVCAVAAVLQFVRAISAKRTASLIVPGLALVVLAVVLNQRGTEQIMSNPAFLHYQMALTHERKGDFESAVAEYEQALAVQPNHLASRKNLAYALTKMGSYDSAVAVSFSYLRHRRTDAEAYNNLGLAYLGQGDTARAEASFREATRHNPKLPQPYYNLGNAALARRDNGTALLQYNRAIEADSSFAAAYTSLAVIFAAAGNTNEAERLLRTGLRHAPDHATLQANLGTLYVKLERGSEAIPLLERSLYLQPQARVVRVTLAAAFLQTQRVADAKEQLKRVLAEEPGNQTAQRLLDEIEAMGENL